MTLTHDEAAVVDRSHDDAAGEVDRDEWDDTEGDADLSSSIALFEGDEGRLDVAQRRALVALLKHRFITARTHPGEWRALIAHPHLIRSRLNDVFLDLHLDREREVAFKRQAAPDGGGRFPTLVRDLAWSREETVIMVYLRRRSRAEEGTGQIRVFVDRQEMLDHVASLRPAHATDQAGDSRRGAKAIENLITAGLLIGQHDADRFEISPAIDVVLPLERLHELLRWLQAQRPGGAFDDTLIDDAAPDDEVLDGSTMDGETDPEEQDA